MKFYNLNFLLIGYSILSRIRYSLSYKNKGHSLVSLLKFGIFANISYILFDLYVTHKYKNLI